MLHFKQKKNKSWIICLNEILGRPELDTSCSRLNHLSSWHIVLLNINQHYRLVIPTPSGIGGKLPASRVSLILTYVCYFSTNFLIWRYFLNVIFLSGSPTPMTSLLPMLRVLTKQPFPSNGANLQSIPFTQIIAIFLFC